jgi:hypothetical protein
MATGVMKDRRASWVAGLLAAALTVGLSACGHRAAVPAGLVHMSRYRFAPATLTVLRNATVDLVNDGQLTSWVVSSAGVGMIGVSPRACQLLSLDGVAPGTYQVLRRRGLGPSGQPQPEQPR